MESALGPEKAAELVGIVTSSYRDAEAIYLYGSAATDTLGKTSDVDIAVLLPPESARAAGALALSETRFRLERSLDRPVDLVNARLAPVVLQKEIIAGGRPIHVKSREALEEFEMLVLSRYGKLNEERREILRDFAATGKAYGP